MGHKRIFSAISLRINLLIADNNLFKIIGILFVYKLTEGSIELFCSPVVHRLSVCPSVRLSVNLQRFF